MKIEINSKCPEILAIRKMTGIRKTYHVILHAVTIYYLILTHSIDNTITIVAPDGSLLEIPLTAEAERITNESP